MENKIEVISKTEDFKLPIKYGEDSYDDFMPFANHVKTILSEVFDLDDDNIGKSIKVRINDCKSLETLLDGIPLLIQGNATAAKISEILTLSKELGKMTREKRLVLAKDLVLIDERKKQKYIDFWREKIKDEACFVDFGLAVPNDIVKLGFAGKRLDQYSFEENSFIEAKIKILNIATGLIKVLLENHKTKYTRSDLEWLKSEIMYFINKDEFENSQMEYIKREWEKRFIVIEEVVAPEPQIEEVSKKKDIKNITITATTDDIKQKQLHILNIKIGVTTSLEISREVAKKALLKKLNDAGIKNITFCD